MSVLFGMVERMRYFTSDTHYGHQNIIRFCDRPYADVDSMNVDLANRAARIVEVGDELWHLGDGTSRSGVWMTPCRTCLGSRSM